MYLTEEQKTEFIDRLQSKQTDPTCPVCGANDWAVNDFLVEAPEFRGEDRVPMALVYCKNCAYIRYFAATEIWSRDELTD